MNERNKEVTELSFNDVTNMFVYILHCLPQVRDVTCMFVYILHLFTSGALDRCFSDEEQRDWIHKEVFCALSSACNIIPVFDNFVMPDPELLPETMRAVTSYNGVKWIHDYQDACVDKVSFKQTLLRFAKLY